MSRRRRKLPLLERIHIEEAVAEGKSIGKLGSMVVFVTGAVPGDVVDVQVTRKRKKYVEGRPVNFHKLSDRRIEPVCRHFGTCGGCKWQFLNYKDQLEFKQKQVVDNLERIGNLALPPVPPIIAASATEFYRNKLEFTFSNRRWLTDEEITQDNEHDRSALGFHIPGRFNRVVDIEKCYLQKDPSNQIRQEIRSFSTGMDYYDVEEHTGFLRNLIIRTSSIGELMVLVSFAKNERKLIDALLDHVQKKFPRITSLLYVINEKWNDTIYDLDVHTYAGNDHIIEELNGLKFIIGPKSFFQTNTEQASELYKVVIEYAGLLGSELVYDLYTGIGTIALLVATQCRQVIGIESVQEAVVNARENARLNKISNAEFHAGDMKDLFSAEFLKKHGTPEVIVTDPPRIGMHPHVIKQLLEIRAHRIVYVSCNPATQARDLALLNDQYRIEKVQPVDMFPHTHHVENVVQLTTKEK